MKVWVLMRDYQEDYEFYTEVVGVYDHQPTEEEVGPSHKGPVSLSYKEFPLIGQEGK